MTVEETIVRDLTDKFKFLDGKINIQRERRIIAEVSREEIIDVIRFAKEKLSFPMLCAITGLDLGGSLQVIYQMSTEKGVVLSMKVDVPKDDPVIESVAPLFPGVTFYERELIDMFGFQIKNIPDSYRYPLPDWWPTDQFPLRKDWKPAGVTLNGKGGPKDE